MEPALCDKNTNIWHLTIYSIRHCALQFTKEFTCLTSFDLGTPLLGFSGSQITGDWVVDRLSNDQVSALSMYSDTYQIFLCHLLLLSNLEPSEMYLNYTPLDSVPPKEGSHSQRKPGGNTYQQFFTPSFKGKQPKFIIQIF